MHFIIIIFLKIKNITFKAKIFNGKSFLLTTKLENIYWLVNVINSLKSIKLTGFITLTIIHT